MNSFYLEKWVHDKIRRAAEENEELRRHLGGNDLGLLSRNDLEKYQIYKLGKTLEYAVRKSFFYRDLFARHGIRISEIKDLGDLSRIPFTEPAMLAEKPYQFLCVPQTEISRVYTLFTAGTTSSPKKVFFADDEIKLITDFMGAAMKAVSLEEDLSQYKAYLLLPNGKPHSQARLLERGINKTGDSAVVGDIELNELELVKDIEKARPDIIFGSTSRLARLTQVGTTHGDLRKIGVKILFVTSEYLSAAMRNRMRQAWNCQVYQHYGMTELGFGFAVECRDHDGFHYDDSDFIVEVVDPDTGCSVSEGEGELVVTTLNRSAMPLIRYRTGDLSRITSPGCSCGVTTSQKIAPILKRIKTMVLLGQSDFIYPSLFDDIFNGLPYVSDYQAIISQEPPRDILTFKVAVNTSEDGLRQEIRKALMKNPLLLKNFEADLMAEPRVEIVDGKEIKREGRTKRVILDTRAR